MTQVEAQKLVTSIVTAFPGMLARMSEDQQRETMNVYRRMLADLDYEAANAAVAHLLATARFLPTIAEIRESALTLTSGERRAGGEAWGDVLRLIGRFGSRRYDQGWSVLAHIDDEVTREVVNALGWANLCDSENQVADRARFIELYDQLAVNYRRKQLSEGLPAMRKFRELQAAQRKEGAISAGGAIRNVFSLLDVGKDGDS